MSIIDSQRMKGVLLDVTVWVKVLMKDRSYTDDVSEEGKEISYLLIWLCDCGSFLTNEKVRTAIFSRVFLPSVSGITTHPVLCWYRCLLCLGMSSFNKPFTEHSLSGSLIQWLH